MPVEGQDKKPWGGRFTAPTDAFVEAFTASVDFDRRLYRHDIAGSIAHARMLARVGVLTEAECQAIVAGLDGERSFGAGEVTLLERSNDRRRLRTRVAPPGGLLVAARSFDPAWTATVDGRKVESLRADGFLTAVPVPAGEHEVEFTYRNGRILTGLAVTLLSLAAAAAMIFGGRRG